MIWKVESGYWDIKIIDDWADEFVTFENYIAPEERSLFYYDGFKKTGDADGEKFRNAQKVTSITKDMVEKR